jgi:hypothetical protein
LPSPDFMERTRLALKVADEMDAAGLDTFEALMAIAAVRVGDRAAILEALNKIELREGMETLKSMIRQRQDAEEDDAPQS